MPAEPAIAKPALAPAPSAPTTARLIVHFIESIKNVLETMAGITVTVGAPTLKAEPVPAYDVSGIIGFSGEFIGSMVVSFEQFAARTIVKAFSGSDPPIDSSDFADAVGELANMIAGSAKKSFGGTTSITVPSVIIGRGHTIARLHDVPCIVIPCHTSTGDFAVEVNIKPQKPGGAAGN